MKFVTVMDMWLLIINIGLLGVIIYFGRTVLKTLARIATVSERGNDSPERTRIIKIIQNERDTYLQMNSMSRDKEAQMTVEALNEILDKINRK
jgi:hypothetical protein